MLNFIIWLYEKIWRAYIFIFIVTIFLLLIAFSFPYWVSSDYKEVAVTTLLFTYLMVVYVTIIGAMISPTYKYSTKYFKEGAALLIDFDLLPFSINKEKQYAHTDTFSKMKKINTNAQSLSVYDKNLLLAYLRAKKSVPIPTLIILAITALFGIITSLIVKYYESEPLILLAIIIITFLVFVYPIKNYILGYQRRNLTESYLINLLENEIGPRK
ncbi:hypothetical protein [Listeria booriae]|uniref:hypothetical protein n=1 Tax=Listeria booriae TaxID=1552123 RepID=UPI0016268B17|nr:hypothetical protein [Listeria booriae]MBC2047431.1 hypothetical protein [Listeria booriae]